ncbi:MAG: interleukin-like EMT inducer domain-containing protein [Gammaproteobacteria bacterium]
MNSRKGLSGCNIHRVSEKLDIPNHWYIGKAYDNGGCFFDSLAQILNAKNPQEEYTEKSLRLLCHDYYLAHREEVLKLHRKDYSHDPNKAPDYSRIQYTAEDLLDLDGGSTAIWGRSNVEALILCRALDLPAINIVEVHPADNGGEALACLTITQEGESPSASNHLDLDIPTLVVSSHLHFVPVLPFRILTTSQTHTQPMFMDEELEEKGAVQKTDDNVLAGINPICLLVEKYQDILNDEVAKKRNHLQKKIENNALFKLEDESKRQEIVAEIKEAEETKSELKNQIETIQNKIQLFKSLRPQASHEALTYSDAQSPEEAVESYLGGDTEIEIREIEEKKADRKKRAKGVSNNQIELDALKKRIAMTSKVLEDSKKEERSYQDRITRLESESNDCDIKLSSLNTDRKLKSEALSSCERERDELQRELKGIEEKWDACEQEHARNMERRGTMELSLRSCAGPCNRNNYIRLNGQDLDVGPRGICVAFVNYLDGVEEIKSFDTFERKNASMPQNAINFIEDNRNNENKLLVIIAMDASGFEKEEHTRSLKACLTRLGAQHHQRAKYRYPWYFIKMKNDLGEVKVYEEVKRTTKHEDIETTLTCSITTNYPGSIFIEEHDKTRQKNTLKINEKRDEILEKEVEVEHCKGELQKVEKNISDNEARKGGLLEELDHTRSEIKRCEDEIPKFSNLLGQLTNRKSELEDQINNGVVPDANAEQKDDADEVYASGEAKENEEKITRCTSELSIASSRLQNVSSRLETLNSVLYKLDHASSNEDEQLFKSELSEIEALNSDVEKLIAQYENMLQMTAMARNLSRLQAINLRSSMTMNDHFLGLFALHRILHMCFANAINELSPGELQQFFDSERNEMSSYSGFSDLYKAIFSDERSSQTFCLEKPILNLLADAERRKIFTGREISEYFHRFRSIYINRLNCFIRDELMRREELVQLDDKDPLSRILQDINTKEVLLKDLELTSEDKSRSILEREEKIQECINNALLIKEKLESQEGEISRRISELKYEIEEKERQINVLDEKRAEKEQKEESANDDLSQHREELAALENRYEEVRRNIEIVRDRLSELEADRISLGVAKNTLELKKADVESKKAGLESGRHALQAVSDFINALIDLLSENEALFFEKRSTIEAIIEAYRRSGVRDFSDLYNRLIYSENLSEFSVLRSDELESSSDNANSYLDLFLEVLDELFFSEAPDYNNLTRTLIFRGAFLDWRECLDKIEQFVTDELETYGLGISDSRKTLMVKQSHNLRLSDLPVGLNNLIKNYIKVNKRPKKKKYQHSNPDWTEFNARNHELKSLVDSLNIPAEEVWEALLQNIELRARYVIRINDDIDMPGISLIFNAHKHIFLKPELKINTTGRNAPEFKYAHARSGSDYSDNNKDTGHWGEDGLCGLPGMSAGHITLSARGDIENRNTLSWDCKGGKGAPGQSGGNGGRGVQGKDALDAKPSEPKADKGIFRDFTTQRGAERYFSIIAEPRPPECSGKGGNGGRAGLGGQDGLGGNIHIEDSTREDRTINDTQAISNAEDGACGRGGDPGEGGMLGANVARVKYWQSRDCSWFNLPERIESWWKIETIKGFSIDEFKKRYRGRYSDFHDRRNTDRNQRQYGTEKRTRDLGRIDTQRKRSTQHIGERGEDETEKVNESHREVSANKIDNFASQTYRDSIDREISTRYRSTESLSSHVNQKLMQLDQQIAGYDSEINQYTHELEGVIKEAGEVSRSINEGNDQKDILDAERNNLRREIENQNANREVIVNELLGAINDLQETVRERQQLQQEKDSAEFDRQVEENVQTRLQQIATNIKLALDAQKESHRDEKTQLEAEKAELDQIIAVERDALEQLKARYMLSENESARLARLQEELQNARWNIEQNIAIKTHTSVQQQYMIKEDYREENFVFDRINLNSVLPDIEEDRLEKSILSEKEINKKINERFETLDPEDSSIRIVNLLSRFSSIQLEESKEEKGLDNDDKIEDYEQLLKSFVEHFEKSQPFNDQDLAVIWNSLYKIGKCISTLKKEKCNSLWVTYELFCLSMQEKHSDVFTENHVSILQTSRYNLNLSKSRCKIVSPSFLNDLPRGVDSNQILSSYMQFLPGIYDDQFEDLDGIEAALEWLSGVLGENQQEIKEDLDRQYFSLHEVIFLRLCQGEPFDFSERMAEMPKGSFKGKNENHMLSRLLLTLKNIFLSQNLNYEFEEGEEYKASEELARHLDGLNKQGQIYKTLSLESDENSPATDQFLKDQILQSSLAHEMLAKAVLDSRNFTLTHPVRRAILNVIDIFKISDEDLDQMVDELSRFRAKSKVEILQDFFHGRAINWLGEIEMLDLKSAQMKSLKKTFEIFVEVFYQLIAHQGLSDTISKIKNIEGYFDDHEDERGLVEKISTLLEECVSALKIALSNDDSDKTYTELLDNFSYDSQTAQAWMNSYLIAIKYCPFEEIKQLKDQDQLRLNFRDSNDSSEYNDQNALCNIFYDRINAVLEQRYWEEVQNRIKDKRKILSNLQNQELDCCQVLDRIEITCFVAFQTLFSFVHMEAFVNDDRFELADKILCHFEKSFSDNPLGCLTDIEDAINDTFKSLPTAESAECKISNPELEGSEEEEKESVVDYNLTLHERLYMNSIANNSIIRHKYFSPDSEEDRLKLIKKHYWDTCIIPSFFQEIKEECGSVSSENLRDELLACICSDEYPTQNKLNRLLDDHRVESKISIIRYKAAMTLKKNFFATYSIALANHEESSWLAIVDVLRRERRHGLTLETINQLLDFTYYFKTFHQFLRLLSNQEENFLYETLYSIVKSAFLSYASLTPPELNLTLKKLFSRFTHSPKYIQLLGAFARALHVSVENDEILFPGAKLMEIVGICLSERAYNNQGVIDKLQKNSINHWLTILNYEKCRLILQFPEAMSEAQRKILDKIMSIKSRAQSDFFDSLVQQIQKRTSKIGSSTSHFVELIIEPLEKVLDKFLRGEWLMSAEIFPLIEGKRLLLWFDLLSEKYDLKNINRNDRSIAEIIELMKNSQELVYKNKQFDETFSGEETKEECSKKMMNFERLEEIIAKICEEYENLIEDEYKSDEEEHRQFKTSEDVKSIVLGAFANQGEYFLKNPSENEDHMIIFMAHMMCIVSVAFNGRRLRDSQLAAMVCYLSSFDTGKGRIGQIYTGEGKSMLNQMLAVACVLRGETVDIITSSSPLAVEGAKDAKLLLSYFDIEVCDICDLQCEADSEERKSRYENHQVFYGDVASFQRDQLLTEFFDLEIRKNPSHTLIVDEVDSLFIDNADKVLYISHHIHDFTYLRTLLEVIWEAVNTYPFVSKEENIKNIAEQIKESIASGVLKFPAYLNDFVKRRLEVWIENAYLAMSMQSDDQYSVFDSGKYENDVIINDLPTGVEQLNSQWSNGLHQFAQMKNRKKFTNETLRAIFISNLSYFKQYATNGRIYGMTGTLGGEAEMNLLEEMYQVDFFAVPRNKPESYTRYWGEVCGNEESWKEAILSDIEEKIFKVDRISQDKLDEIGNQIVDFQRKIEELDREIRELNDSISHEKNLILIEARKLENFERKTSNISHRKADGSQKSQSELLGEREQCRNDRVISEDELEVLNERVSYKINNLSELNREKCEYHNRMKEAIALSSGFKSRAVLLICETKQATDILSSAISGFLESRYRNDVNYRKPTVYNSNLQDFQLTRLYPGDVMVATNIAGRGTDFEISPELESHGGLHVILSYMPSNVRIEEQAFGRAGRQGQPGSSKFVVLDRRREHDTSVTIEMLREERTQAESRRILNISSTKLPRDQVEQQLMIAFKNLQNEIKEILQAKSLDSDELRLQLKSLQNEWSFWLDAHETDLENVYREERFKQKLFNEFEVFKQRQFDNVDNDMERFIVEPAELMRIATYYASQNRHHDAIRCYDKCIERNPHFSGFAHYYKAQSILSLGSDLNNKKRARRELKKSIRLFDEEIGRFSISNQIIELVSDKEAENRHGLMSDIYSRTNAEEMRILGIHRDAAKEAVGGELCFSELSDNDEVAPMIRDRLVDELPDHIKGYRISKKAEVKQYENGSRELYYGEENHAEKIIFFGNVAQVKDKVLDFLQDRSGKNKTLEQRKIKLSELEEIFTDQDIEELSNNNLNVQVTLEDFCEQLESFLTSVGVLKRPSIKFSENVKPADQLSIIRKAIRENIVFFVADVPNLPEIPMPNEGANLQTAEEPHLPVASQSQLEQVSPPLPREIQNFIQNISGAIENSLGTIRRIPEIRLENRDLDSYFDGATPQVVGEYIEKSLHRVLNLVEDLNTEGFDWNVFVCAMIGVAQILAGVALCAVNPAFAQWGKALIREGIGDIIFAMQAQINGNFSWEAYANHKVQSLILTVLTAGLGGGEVSSLDGVSDAGKVMLGDVVGQAFELIANAGLNLLTDQLSAKLINEILDCIQKELEPKLQEKANEKIEKLDREVFLIAGVFSELDQIESDIRRLVNQVIIMKDEIERHVTSGAAALAGKFSNFLQQYENSESELGAVIQIAQVASMFLEAKEYINTFKDIFDESVKVLGKVEEEFLSLKNRFENIEEKLDDSADDKREQLKRFANEMFSEIIQIIREKITNIFLKFVRDKSSEFFSAHIEKAKDNITSSINNFTQSTCIAENRQKFLEIKQAASSQGQMEVNSEKMLVQNAGEVLNLEGEDVPDLKHIVTVDGKKILTTNDESVSVVIKSGDAYFLEENFSSTSSFLSSAVQLVQEEGSVGGSRGVWDNIGLPPFSYQEDMERMLDLCPMPDDFIESDFQADMNEWEKLEYWGKLDSAEKVRLRYEFMQRNDALASSVEHQPDSNFVSRAINKTNDEFLSTLHTDLGTHLGIGVVSKVSQTAVERAPYFLSAYSVSQAQNEDKLPVATNEITKLAISHGLGERIPLKTAIVAARLCAPNPPMVPVCGAVGYLAGFAASSYITSLAGNISEEGIKGTVDQIKSVPRPPSDIRQLLDQECKYDLQPRCLLIPEARGEYGLQRHGFFVNQSMNTSSSMNWDDRNIISRK